MLTIEVMRAAIEKACDTHETCDTCPVFPYREEGEFCYTETDDPKTDAKVERNYRLLFGQSAKPQYFNELLKIVGKEAVEHFCLCSAMWYLMDGKTEAALKYMSKYLELVQVQDRVQDA